jgi:prenyltransferase beta subunit
MLQALSLSPSQLGDSSSLVREFLRSQLGPEGGFCDRSGRSDLYYTVFGLESLIALRAPVPPEVIPFLLGFGLGEKLDLVHLCCLIRCRAGARIATSGVELEALLSRIEGYRTADGGYNPELCASTGSAYGCFLVAMAYEDLEKQIPSKDRAVHCLQQLRAADGGFANQPNQAFGLTPSTAATATLLRSLGQDFPPGLDSWLLSRRHPEGGFFATPAAPIPDLLSTATALHALSRMGVSFDLFREPCLDFIQSLWTGNGAFLGSWADSTPDCEYTYYGLLALGHLGI